MESKFLLLNFTFGGISNLRLCFECAAKSSVNVLKREKADQIVDSACPSQFFLRSKAVSMARLRLTHRRPRAVNRSVD